MGSQLRSCKKRLEEAEDEQFRVKTPPTSCCALNGIRMNA